MVEAPRKTSEPSRIRSVIPRLLFAGGALAMLYYWVPMQDLSALLQGMPLVALLAGLLLQLASRLATAWRMTLLARYQGLALDYRAMLRILLSASFYTFVLPGIVLGGAATYVKYRQHGGTAGQSLGNIVLNKGLEVLATLWLGVLALAWSWLGWSAALLALAGLLDFIGMAHWLLRGGGAIDRLRHAASQSRHAPVKHLGRLLAALNVLESLRPAQTRHLLLAALAAQTVPVVSMFVFGWGLGLPVNPIDVAWIYAAIYLMALLPLTVANIGVREFTLITVLAPLGINAAGATAWSLCLYLGPLVSAVLGLLLEAGHRPPRDSSPQSEGTDGTRE